MSTKLTKRQQQWLETIIECRTSGLSDRQWCDEHGISSSTFYYNVKKLQDKACDIPETEALPADAPQVQEVVPLSFAEEAPQTVPAQPTQFDLDTEPLPVPALSLNSCGFHIEIRNHASAEVILNTMQALQQLC